MSGERAAVLRCPNCGAPAAPGAARCEYCRSRLATVSCPKCLSVLFAGARFCPHCGVARQRVEGSEPTTTTCPACRAAMAWVTVGSVDLLECGTCDGTWVEAAVFERLCADRESQAAILHTNAAPVAGAAVRIIRYRPCLRCGKLMNRVNFGLVSGTILDVCKGHGSFLERGELHQVMRFILDGGLDRTRDAKREALAEAERRLRETEERAPRSTSTWDEHSLQRFLSALTDR